MQCETVLLSVTLWRPSWRDWLISWVIINWGRTLTATKIYQHQQTKIYQHQIPRIYQHQLMRRKSWLTTRLLALHMHHPTTVNWHLSLSFGRNILKMQRTELWMHSTRLMVLRATWVEAFVWHCHGKWSRTFQHTETNVGRKSEAATLMDTVKAAWSVPAPGFSEVQVEDLQEIIGQWLNANRNQQLKKYWRRMHKRN